MAKRRRDRRAKFRITIKVKKEIICERQPEVISAKIRGSQLSLLANASLLWRDQAVLTLEVHDYRPPELSLAPANGAPLSLAGVEIEDLVGTLVELKYFRCRTVPARAVDPDLAERRVTRRRDVHVAPPAR